MVKSREEVTEMIKSVKVQKGILWKDVAQKLHKSKEWTVAACLGQMKMSRDQAVIVAEIFDLPDEARAWLQTSPKRGVPGIPNDPTIYRIYEVSYEFIHNSNKC